MRLEALRSLAPKFGRGIRCEDVDKRDTHGFSHRKEIGLLFDVHDVYVEGDALLRELLGLDQRNLRIVACMGLPLESRSASSFHADG